MWRRIAVIAACIGGVSLGVLILLASCSWILHPHEYRSGQEDARRDIAAGNPQLGTIGLLREHGIDHETGLPIFSIGCCVTAENLAYIDGYNAETHRAQRAHELDAFVLKNKLATRAAIEARFAAEGGIELTEESPSAVRPGGRYRIDFAPGSGKNAAAELFAIDTKTGERQELYPVSGPGVKVLFADGGTTLLVRDDGFERSFSIDIPHAIPIQFFSDPYYRE